MCGTLEAVTTELLGMRLQNAKAEAWGCLGTEFGDGPEDEYHPPGIFKLLHHAAAQLRDEAGIICKIDIENDDPERSSPTWWGGEVEALACIELALELLSDCFSTKVALAEEGGFDV